MIGSADHPSPALFLTVARGVTTSAVLPLGGTFVNDPPIVTSNADVARRAPWVVTVKGW